MEQHWVKNNNGRRATRCMQEKMWANTSGSNHMQLRVGSTTCKRKQVAMHKKEQLHIIGSKNTQAKATTQVGASVTTNKEHNLQITNLAKQRKKQKQELKITQNIKKL